MRLAIAVLLVMTGATGAHALDCARVQALNDKGERAADIAHQLGITTPEVQACLAGELGEEKAVKPPPETQRSGSLVAPQLPSGDSAIPRPPNQ
jgi:hypothetical protein